MSLSLHKLLYDYDNHLLFLEQHYSLAWVNSPFDRYSTIKSLEQNGMSPRTLTQ